MRIFYVLILFVLFTSSLFAQQMSSKYYEENPIYEEPDFEFENNDTLFYLLPFSVNETVLEREAKYNFSYVDYSYRGTESRYEKYFLNGLDLSPVFDEFADYSLLSALRRVQSSYLSTYSGGHSRIGSYTPALSEYYSLRTEDMSEINSLRLQYSDRNYRGALSLYHTGTITPKWKYVLGLSAKAGRDRIVDGVFTEAYHLGFLLEHEFNGGDRASLFFLAAPNQYSSRSWAMQETFDLTGNNFYNPSWGMFGNRERSSRVRNNFTPVSVFTYDIAIGDKDRLCFSAMYRFGENTRGGLTWFDAMSPLPDTYAYLPSYYSDKQLSESVAEAWLNADERYIQVNWNEMYYQNVAAGAQSRYIVDEAVERMNNFQISFSGISHFDNGVTNSYGLRYRSDESRFFKRAVDMLGGEWIYNIDQYLIDDVTYGDKYHNDMYNPDRKVYAGDEFGYNYLMRHSGLTVYGDIDYVKGRWNVDIGGEISFSSLSRRGLYKKETVENDSYGDSGLLKFTTYSLLAKVKYALTANSSLSGVIYASEYEPLYDNVFLSPEISNIVVPDVKNIALYGFDIKFRMARNPFAFDLSAYWNTSYNGKDIYRYYDDAFSEYCDMVVSGIRTRNSGIELGVELDVTGRLMLSSAYAYNSYKYIDNPIIDIYRDVDTEILYSSGVSYMKGHVSSNSPQQLFMLGLSYDLFGSWWLKLDYMLVADRYVSLSPLRRSDRMLARASSVEDIESWRKQEKLPAASNLDLFLYHRFDLGYNSLAFSLAIRNILGRKDVVYGGYEQMRFRKTTTDIQTHYRPYGSKYCYAYPRYCYITLTYEF